MGPSIIEENAQNDPSVVPEHEEKVQKSDSSWIQSITSIIEELTAGEDAPVMGAVERSVCLGSICGSVPDARLALVLIMGNALLASAIVVAIRARRRRLNSDPSDG